MKRLIDSPIRILLAGFCFATLTVFGSGTTQAQDYPAKPIRLVVPWPAGGGTDTSARMFAQPLSERLGQPVVIENKPGAGGNIGSAVVAQEKPDGYTLLQGSAAPHGINPHLYKQLGFEPIKDFTFIAHSYSVPSFLVVPANSPFKTAQELVAYGKANPGKLNFGSSGIGTGHHLYGIMFMNAAGFEAVHIPYKGGSPMETALVAGQIDFSLDPPTCLPFIEAGKMRVLGVASKVRNAALPDVPTLDELGIPGVYSSTYFGLLGPANMPKNIVDRLNREMNAIILSDDMRARLTKMGAEPGRGTSEEFQAFAEAELKRFEDLVKKSGADKID
ncbi:MAG: tripartite tricarboxylate transporter substrate binding protein [Candidatus Accumulibacter sp.]|jgi:tripartite-type tricarboxylate transporter receptor subunit TctC|nr:tripartite tricarboxylate transporter substrate binding protein [Accumulibacter sp.]